MTRHPRRIDHRGNDRGDAVRPGPHLGGVEVTSPALEARPGPWAWRQNFREIDVRVLACNGLAGAGKYDQIGFSSARCGQKSALARKGRRKIVNAVLDVIGAALARRDRVETRGLGSSP